MSAPQSSGAASAPLRLRFVRLNPRFDRHETLELLKSEVKTHQKDDDKDNKYPLPVPWLNSKEHQLEFFAIPGEFSLNKSTSFQSGRVYGMDVTSGAAVAALLFDLFDVHKSAASDEKGGHKGNGNPMRVLDVCCAPGLKLCMMADLAPPSSTLVGVDISSQRISLCKNIVKKYHIDENTSASKQISTIPAKENVEEHSNANYDNSNPSRATIRLYCADGTTFGTKEQCEKTNNTLVFDSNAAVEEFRNRGKRKRMNKSARAREKRRLLELQKKEDITIDDSAGDAQNNTEIIAMHPDSNANENKETNFSNCDKNNEDRGSELSIPPFDHVLVDAECGTDGAIRHIEKRQLNSRSPAWDSSNMDELVDLQKRLIQSGFRLLKRGGTMVYSTCSLSSRQNEEVVQWLLDKCKDTFIIPVSFGSLNKSASNNLPFIEEGSIPGTVRFNPIRNETKDEHSMVDLLFPGSGFFLAKIGKRQQSS